MENFINMLDMAIILTTAVFCFMCAYHIHVNKVFNFALLSFSFMIFGLTKINKWFDRVHGDLANVNDLIEDIAACSIAFCLIMFYKILLEEKND